MASKVLPQIDNYIEDVGSVKGGVAESKVGEPSYY